MRCITFYSYKGGVGRTLALANVARYLALLGQRVFALDLDFEAPGLHYKLSAKQGEAIERGAVDLLAAFVDREPAPATLEPYVVAVEPRDVEAADIHLMPAGATASATYWRQLARLDWHELFYSEAADGLPLLLELKDRISLEYEPDFLLIDARTGITELGGVATTVLADDVLCLLAHNRENLEGTRAVLRSIVAADRAPVRETMPGLYVAVSRLPEDLSDELENEIIGDVRSYLAMAVDGVDPLPLADLFVLHSKPDLQVAEAVTIEGAAQGESRLLRDYLELFRRLLPQDAVDQRVEALVKSLLARADDDLQSVEREARMLRSVYPHPALNDLRVRLAELRVDRETAAFERLHGERFDVEPRGTRTDVVDRAIETLRSARAAVLELGSRMDLEKDGEAGGVDIETRAREIVIGLVQLSPAGLFELVKDARDALRSRGEKDAAQVIWDAALCVVPVIVTRHEPIAVESVRSDDGVRWVKMGAATEVGAALEEAAESAAPADIHVRSRGEPGGRFSPPLSLVVDAAARGRLVRDALRYVAERIQHDELVAYIDDPAEPSLESPTGRYLTGRLNDELERITQASEGAPVYLAFYRDDRLLQQLTELHAACPALRLIELSQDGFEDESEIVQNIRDTLSGS